MPGALPVAIAKPGQGGVLPISLTDKGAAAAHAHGQAHGPPRNASSRGHQQQQQQQQRTKVVIRRLPPAITQAEVEAALGDEWKVGNGKITWSEFKPGKIPKDVAKLSKPARTYLQVSDPSHLEPLSQAVAKASFTDARSTAADPVLIAPPSLDFAPYARVPSNKRRNDARQGTIDQDPEFIEFLQSLTDPIAKPKALDAAAIAATKEEPITVTPLIQHLRQKKAAKEKSASNKAAKQQKQDAKDAANADSKSDRKRGGRDGAKSADDKTRSAKAADRNAKDSGKGQSRREKAQVARQQANSDSSTATAATSDAAKTQAATAPPSKRAEGGAPPAQPTRASQRDAGGRGGRGSGRNARGGKANNDSRASTPIPSAQEPAALAAPTAPASPKVPKDTATPATATNSGAAASASGTATKPQGQPKPSGGRNNAGKASQRPAAPVDPTATRAFLKHANPSQGITEALIKDAMSAFGDVQAAEIDKRKGFAFVTFAAPAALQAAIAASPVAVAQGSVQVLERKDRAASANTPAASQPQAPPTGPAATTAAQNSSASPAPTANPARGGRNAGSSSRGARGGRRSGRGGGGGGGNNQQSNSGTGEPRAPAPAAPAAAAAAGGAGVTAT